MSDHSHPPALAKFPNSRAVSLTAEHATVELAASDHLRIGAKVEVIPGYSDFTFVLHDRVLGHRNGRVETCWPLLARGMLQ
jgi:D-serine deaminase-like pyridoxal phosphate-dependent protein